MTQCSSGGSDSGPLKTKSPQTLTRMGAQLFQYELSSFLLRGPHLRPPRLLCGGDSCFSGGAHAAFDPGDTIAARKIRRKHLFAELAAVADLGENSMSEMRSPQSPSLSCQVTLSCAVVNMPLRIVCFNSCLLTGKNLLR